MGLQSHIWCLKKRRFCFYLRYDKYVNNKGKIGQTQVNWIKCGLNTGQGHT